MSGDDDRRSGPGLGKVRKAQFVVTRRTIELVAVREGWWSRMLDEADIVSEGETVDEDDGRAYYGSTNLRTVIEGDAHAFAAVVLGDPHARLRLLRLAHREAVVRAGAPLNVMHAELTVRVIADERGGTLAIDIDVNAAIAELDLPPTGHDDSDHADGAGKKNRKKKSKNKGSKKNIV